MSTPSRIVFMSGKSVKKKVLGFSKHSVVVQGKHRKIYYNSDHVKTIDYVPLERINFSLDSQVSEVFL